MVLLLATLTYKHVLGSITEITSEILEIFMSVENGCLKRWFDCVQCREGIVKYLSIGKANYLTGKWSVTSKVNS